MQISEDFSDTQLVIRAYEPGAVLVNQNRYTRSLALTPERVLDGALPDHLEELEPLHIREAIDCGPELLIIGSTAGTHRLDRDIPRQLGRLGIGLEVMNLGAACRTYNILLSEGRKVVCLLLLEPE